MTGIKIKTSVTLANLYVVHKALAEFLLQCFLQLHVYFCTCYFLSLSTEEHAIPC